MKFLITILLVLLFIHNAYLQQPSHMMGGPYQQEDQQQQQNYLPEHQQQYQGNQQNDNQKHMPYDQQQNGNQMMNGGHMGKQYPWDNYKPKKKEPKRPKIFTITVTVAPRNVTSYKGYKLNPVAFSIDGKNKPVLRIKRGNLYIMKMESTDGKKHPFYISTSRYGKGEGKYNSDEVLGQNATDGEFLIFLPNSNTPRKLYYQCKNHYLMGNTIFIEEN